MNDRVHSPSDESKKSGPEPGERPEALPPPGFLALLQSVFAALIGVQSEAARHRDFTRGRPMHYIIIGVVATIVVILAFVGIVRLILHVATG